MLLCTVTTRRDVVAKKPIVGTITGIFDVPGSQEEPVVIGQ
jgi:hypothetical protein